jgi:hypothetical protein
MLPTDVREARTEIYAANDAYLAALRAYLGAVGRQEEQTVQRTLLGACQHAADAYAAALLHLAELLLTLPPSRAHQVIQTQVRALQRTLARGRRMLRTTPKQHSSYGLPAYHSRSFPFICS